MPELRRITTYSIKSLDSFEMMAGQLRTEKLTEWSVEDGEVSTRRTSVQKPQ